MENEIPKLDLPEDVITGRLMDTNILSLYTNFPCRLKAKIFVFCKKGNIEASINMENYVIKGNCIAIVPHGSILKVNKIEDDIELYFIGFSSSFLKQINPVKSIVDTHYAIKRKPVLELNPKIAQVVYENIEPFVRTQEEGAILNKDFNRHIFMAIMYGLGILYENEKPNSELLSTNERITQDFSQAVMDNYIKERNVSFYANLLRITPAYLSTIIKQTTGKTCTDIIAEMVIMDAKAQLKSTNLPIQEIAYSLNFTNVSFFGKYFKRHVGIGPLEYRKGGSDRGQVDKEEVVSKRKE
ncbi:MAG: helix-turn-helix domain-containing protein [Parabacteroides sp.]|nr:helix-turn-helix domain-containing protein [Parabacteroides sp.]